MERRWLAVLHPAKVAKMTDTQLTRLCQNPDLIRNRLKIFAARTNARAYLKIQEEFGSFDAYIWAYVGEPIVNHPKPGDPPVCLSPLSERIARDLKKRGMMFVGPKIIYSFMQAVGMVNDHLVTCPKHKA